MTSTSSPGVADGNHVGSAGEPLWRRSDRPICHASWAFDGMPFWGAATSIATTPGDGQLSRTRDLRRATALAHLWVRMTRPKSA